MEKQTRTCLINAPRLDVNWIELSWLKHQAESIIKNKVTDSHEFRLKEKENASLKDINEFIENLLEERSRLLEKECPCCAHYNS